jgi:hypothetical protein
MRELDEGGLAGGSLADFASMRWACRRFLDPSEKARIERLELFDEFEEWHMIQEHYSITVAVNDAIGLLEGFGFHPQTPLPEPGPPAFPGRPLPCAD